MIEITDEKVELFRDQFPKGILPSGKSARSIPGEIKQKLTWFVKNFMYDWDTILKATVSYVEYFQVQNYKFMQTASYFISKRREGVRSSSLAEWCEKTEDENIINDDFDINV